jgi:hypothetical protein
MNPKVWVAIITTVGLIVVALIRYWPHNAENVTTTQKRSVDSLVPPRQIHARYKLSGTVVDDKTNGSIVGAEISVVGQPKEYYSEQNGNFYLEVDTNLIRIQVKKGGYDSRSESYFLPNESLIIPLTKKNK